MWPRCCLDAQCFCFLISDTGTAAIQGGNKGTTSLVHGLSATTKAAGEGVTSAAATAAGGRRSKEVDLIQATEVDTVGSTEAESMDARERADWGQSGNAELDGLWSQQVMTAGTSQMQHDVASLGNESGQTMTVVSDQMRLGKDRSLQPGDACGEIVMFEALDVMDSGERMLQDDIAGKALEVVLSSPQPLSQFEGAEAAAMSEPPLSNATKHILANSKEKEASDLMVGAWDVGRCRRSPSECWRHLKRMCSRPERLVRGQNAGQ